MLSLLIVLMFSKSIEQEQGHDQEQENRGVHGLGKSARCMLVGSLAPPIGFYRRSHRKNPEARQSGIVANKIRVEARLKIDNSEGDLRPG